MKGQSLFEVVFAVGIAGLVLIALVSLSSTSVGNSTSAKNNALATKFAQEGSEYVRQQRDTSWDNFYAENGSAKNLGTLSWPPAGSCNITANTLFCRTVTLTSVSADEVSSLVSVSWNDAQGDHQVRSATTLTKWK